MLCEVRWRAGGAASSRARRLLLYLGATTLDRIKRLEDSNAAMALKLDTVNKEVVAAN